MPVCRLVALILAFPCLAAAQPYAHTVHVADVSDLQAAVFALDSDTEILIADGTYALTNTLVIDGGIHNVSIRGESGDRDAVVIVGRGMSNPNYGNVPHGFMIRNAQDVEIADLTVRDCWFHNVIIQGEQGAQRPTLRNLRSIDAGEQHFKVTVGSDGQHCDDGVIEDCLIEFTTTARSDYTNGIDVLAGHDWTVRDCTLRNIRAPAGQLAGPAILFWQGAQGTVVERNRLFNCQRGISLGLVPRAGNDHAGGTVRNNFVHRAPNESGDVGIHLADCPGFQVLHNTVILSGTYPYAIEYRYATSSGTNQYNLTDAEILQRDGAQATLAGDLTSAISSWFVDMAAGDLHLTDSAVPALDAALPLTAVPDDIDGETRDTTPDIGADEHSPGAGEGPAGIAWR